MTELTRMPGQNDVLLRDTRCHQLIGNGAVRPVVLNPYLVADDVDVDDRAVNALDAVPTDVQEFIMVAFRIHDELGIDLAVRRPVTSVFRETLANDPAITIQPIHCTILSCRSSKTTTCRFNPETTNCPNWSASTRCLRNWRQQPEVFYQTPSTTSPPRSSRRMAFGTTPARCG